MEKEKKVKIKYKGIYDGVHDNGSFRGPVKTGDQIEVTAEMYDREYKTSHAWELVEEKKEPKESKKGDEKS